MHHTNIHFISSVNCKYTLNGKNLAELRKVKLRPIARALGVIQDGSKNDMLAAIIAILNSKSAEPELMDLVKARVAAAAESENAELKKVAKKKAPKKKK